MVNTELVGIWYEVVAEPVGSFGHYAMFNSNRRNVGGDFGLDDIVLKFLWVTNVHLLCLGCLLLNSPDGRFFQVVRMIFVNFLLFYQT